MQGCLKLFGGGGVQLPLLLKMDYRDVIRDSNNECLEMIIQKMIEPFIGKIFWPIQTQRLKSDKCYQHLKQNQQTNFKLYYCLKKRYEFTSFGTVTYLADSELFYCLVEVCNQKSSLIPSRLKPAKDPKSSMQRIAAIGKTEPKDHQNSQP